MDSERDAHNATREQLAIREAQRLNAMRDPCGKAQLAFVRAMRRGSVKRSKVDDEVKLIQAAQKAIPPATKVKRDGEERKAG